MCKYHKIISAHIVSEMETTFFAANSHSGEPWILSFCCLCVYRGGARQNPKMSSKISSPVLFHQTVIPVPLWRDFADGIMFAKRLTVSREIILDHRVHPVLPHEPLKADEEQDSQRDEGEGGSERLGAHGWLWRWRKKPPAKASGQPLALRTSPSPQPAWKLRS